MIKKTTLSVKSLLFCMGFIICVFSIEAQERSCGMVEYMQEQMKNPEYAQEACDVINGIIQDTKDGEEFDLGEAFMFGGLIVGTALLAATGVGLLALGAGAAGVAGASAVSATILTALFKFSSRGL